jgi:hypothetical protein
MTVHPMASKDVMILSVGVSLMPGHTIHATFLS